MSIPHMYISIKIFDFFSFGNPHYLQNPPWLKKENQAEENESNFYFTQIIPMPVGQGYY